MKGEGRAAWTVAAQGAHRKVLQVWDSRHHGNGENQIPLVAIDALCVDPASLDQDPWELEWSALGLPGSRSLFPAYNDYDDCEDAPAPHCELLVRKLLELAASNFTYEQIVGLCDVTHARTLVPFFDPVSDDEHFALGLHEYHAEQARYIMANRGNAIEPEDLAMLCRMDLSVDISVVASVVASMASVRDTLLYRSLSDCGAFDMATPAARMPNVYAAASGGLALREKKEAAISAVLAWYEEHGRRYENDPDRCVALRKGEPVKFSFKRQDPQTRRRTLVTSDINSEYRSDVWLQEAFAGCRARLRQRAEE